MTNCLATLLACTFAAPAVLLERAKLIIGQQTDIFKRSGRDGLSALSFSIMGAVQSQAEDPAGSSRSLNLAAKDHRELEIWLRGLQYLTYGPPPPALLAARREQLLQMARHRRRIALAGVHFAGGDSAAAAAVEHDAGAVTQRMQRALELQADVYGSERAAVTSDPGGDLAQELQQGIRKKCDVLSMGASAFGQCGHGHPLLAYSDVGGGRSASDANVGGGSPSARSSRKAARRTSAAAGGLGSSASQQRTAHSPVSTPAGMEEWAYQSSPRMVHALLGKAVRQLACGAQHSMALSETGEVYVWGNGDHGRLGLGHTQHVGTPRRLSRGKTDPSAGPYRFTFLAAGHRHSLGVSEQGVLHTWGCNAQGQLGLGDTLDRLQPTPVHFREEEDRGMHGESSRGGSTTGSSSPAHRGRSTSQFSLNQNSLLGRSQLLESTPSMDGSAQPALEGLLQAWTAAGRSVQSESLMVATSASDVPSFVVSGAAGAAFTLILDESGRLYSAGDNRHGQLGLGTAAPLPPSPHCQEGVQNATAHDPSISHFCVMRQLIALDESVVSLACGAHHAGAVGLGGRLWTWGWNGTGALGTGDQCDSHTPLHVEALGERVVTVACGAAHTVALAVEQGPGGVRSGDSPAVFMAWAWGAAGHGQLGHVLLPAATGRTQGSEGAAGAPVHAVPSRTLSEVLALAPLATAQVQGDMSAEQPLTIGCVPVSSLCIPQPKRMMAPLATQLALTLVPDMPAADASGAFGALPASKKIKLGATLEAKLKEHMLAMITAGAPLTEMATHMTPRSLLHLAVSSPGDLTLPATDTVTRLLSGTDSMPAGSVRTVAAGHFHTAVVTFKGQLMVAGSALDGRLGVDIPPAPPMAQSTISNIEQNATSALGGYTITPSHVDAAKREATAGSPDGGVALGGLPAIAGLPARGRLQPQIPVAGFMPADVFSTVALDEGGAVVQSLQDLHDMGLGADAPRPSQDSDVSQAVTQSARVTMAGRGSVAGDLMAASSTRRRLSVTQSSRVLLVPRGSVSAADTDAIGSTEDALARRAHTVYTPSAMASMPSGPVVVFGYLRKRAGLLMLPLSLPLHAALACVPQLPDAQAVANAVMCRICADVQPRAGWDMVPSIVRAGDRLLRVQEEHIGVSASLLDDLSGRTDAHMHDISAASALQALILTPDTLLGMGTRWGDGDPERQTSAPGTQERSASIGVSPPNLELQGLPRRRSGTTVAPGPVPRPRSLSHRPTSVSLAFDTGGAGLAAAAAAAAMSALPSHAGGHVLGPAAVDLFTVSGRMGGAGRFGAFSDSMAATLALVKQGAVDMHDKHRSGRSSVLLDSLAAGPRQGGAHRTSAGAGGMGSLALGVASTYRPSACPDLQHLLAPASHSALGAGSARQGGLGEVGSTLAGYTLPVSTAMGLDASPAHVANECVINTLGVGLTLVEALAAKEVRAVSCGGAHTVVLVAKEWIGDAEAAHCMRCSSKFTFSVRRHHCRNCGGVFCAKCSSHRHPLLTLGFVDAVRVCDGCHALLNAVAEQDDHGGEEHLRELGVW